MADCGEIYHQAADVMARDVMFMVLWPLFAVGIAVTSKTGLGLGDRISR